MKHRPWRIFLVTALAVLSYAAFGDAIRSRIGTGRHTLPDKDDALRVMTWNLRNFAGDPNRHDLQAIQATFGALQPDLVAIQEITDVDALARLLPGWRLELSRAGGRGGQHLGFAYRPERLELVQPTVEHGDITLDGRVRPALSAYFRDRQNHLDFHAVSVHLKARPEGYAVRPKQWTALRQIVATLRPDDNDVLILGDFNVTGPKGGTPHQELAALDLELARGQLRRVANPAGCTAYWDGVRRDAWKEPSELDLIVVRGLNLWVNEDSVALPATHCARHTCDVFRSTEAYPVPSFSDISDHCPVILDL